MSQSVLGVARRALSMATEKICEALLPLVGGNRIGSSPSRCNTYAMAAGWQPRNNVTSAAVNAETILAIGMTSVFYPLRVSGLATQYYRLAAKCLTLSRHLQKKSPVHLGSVVWEGTLSLPHSSSGPVAEQENFQQQEEWMGFLERRNLADSVHFQDVRIWGGSQPIVGPPRMVENPLPRTRITVNSKCA
jgi:hypothetical protein